MDLKISFLRRRRHNNFGSPLSEESPMAKILIVDDSDIFRLELSNVLIAGGHQCLEAENGVVGVLTARDNFDIDLIISDVNMPEMDGLEMVKQIKLIPRYEKTPIFMLTTENSQDLRSIGKSVGVLLLVAKPFDSQKLQDVIKKVVDR